jgi:hypothetical protein
MEPLCTSVNVPTIETRRVSTSFTTPPMMAATVHRRRGHATRVSDRRSNVRTPGAGHYPACSSASTGSTTYFDAVSTSHSSNAVQSGRSLTTTATLRSAPRAATITVASRTHNGGNRYQEDRARNITRSDGGICAGLFDGHSGEKVAQMCFDKLPDHADLPLGSIIPALNEHARDLTGGSTASIVRVSPTGLVEVERVGDSSVRLYNLAASSDGIELPEDDHSATSVAEYRRVSEKFGAAGGGFRWFQQGVGLIPPTVRPVFTKTDAGEWQLNPAGGFQHCDVHKNWASYFVTSYNRPLAMTRAVGDNEFRPFGLISEPAVATHQLEAGTRSAIILASDGLWDIFPLADAYTIVGRSDLFGNADAAADELLRLGMERGHAAWGPVIDNITITVIFIDMPAAPEPEPEPEASASPVAGDRVQFTPAQLARWAADLASVYAELDEEEDEEEDDDGPIVAHVVAARTKPTMAQIAERAADAVFAFNALDMAQDYPKGEEPLCFICHESAADSGWANLCSRRCYYTMRDLHAQYESFKVDEPDVRVVVFFTHHPDGGGHMFADPVRIQEYIAWCDGEIYPPDETASELIRNQFSTVLDELRERAATKEASLIRNQFRTVLDELRERAATKEATLIRNQFRDVLDELLWCTTADDTDDIDEYYDWDPYSREYSDYAHYPDYEDSEDSENSEDQSEISEEELRQMDEDAMRDWRYEHWRERERENW